MKEKFEGGIKGRNLFKVIQEAHECYTASPMASCNCYLLDLHPVECEIQQSSETWEWSQGVGTSNKIKPLEKVDFL